jgi:hypothetical protein
MSLDEQVSRWARRNPSVDVQALIALGMQPWLAALAPFPYQAALMSAGRPVAEWWTYYYQMTKIAHERALAEDDDGQPAARRKPVGPPSRPRLFMPRDLLPEDWPKVRGRLLDLHAKKYSSNLIAGQLANDFGLDRAASTVRDWLRIVLKEQSSAEA